VSACVDTGLALDKSGDTANFANPLMNENKENLKQEVLNSSNKSVQLIGVKTYFRCKKSFYLSDL
jgi:hypothetical protein